MSCMHIAIRSHSMLTQRDLYYRDPELFGSQRTVNNMVTRVSQTFQLSRAELGVCASPNGFVWGRVQINSKHSTHLTEHAIPDESQVKSIYSDAAWVLIVEKHAIYQTLRSIEFLDRGKTYGVHVPGAVVTGKGYPDRATRSFLATWASNRRAPRLFFLMDADPHGVDILRVYSEALKGVQVHWIGLRVQQWLALSQAHPFSIVPLNGSDP
ncbi:endodeoxyribonuclease [Malassezia psittaci]|uniref:DNA topoisomerase (ATP-hydrolyzing) n=1 Tax=Malassezia psittaci TaxID=1821823 RepID=A0AAF0F285_9BASI|nr:endodeoxyribonuclease [Malassezia psittaci]